MRLSRLVTFGMAACALVAAAWAQFDGPAPLAWRWSSPSSMLPSGMPIVSGDQVFVTAGNRLFSLDSGSGNQRWRFPLADPIPGTFRNGMVLVDGALVAPADNKLIYAVDAATGKSRWQHAPASPVVGQPVVAGNLIVYAMSDNSLMAIKASDGTAAWQTPYRVFSGLVGSLAANGNNVVYMTGANEVVSLNALTQRIVWQQRLTQVNSDAVPVFYGDYLFFNTGTFVACLSGSGSVRWQQNIGEPLAFSPAVTPEGVLTVTVDGRAFIFDPANGRPITRQGIELGSMPAVRPTAAGKMFVVPTTNGAINLVSPRGEVAWSFLIRPIGIVTVSRNANTGGGGGSNRGGLGSGGGGGTTATEQRVWALPASGPAVLSGSTLFVQAIDGSLLAFDRNQGVDLTGPSVKMIWPSPGDQVSGQPPLEFIFRIEDESTGINTKTLKIQVDGQDMEYDFGRDGFAIVRISSIGKNKPLMDGRRNITVSVSDWLGNATNAKFTLTVDNTLKPLVRPSGTGPSTTGGAGPTGGPGKGPGAGGGR